MSAARLRWIKFWPQDWHGNKELRTCSPAARGVWMDLLCIAHDGTPYGHVTMNGKPATLRQIAAVAGLAEREAAKLVAELEEAGVFSRAENGAIYSRRMVKDMDKRLKGISDGKGGGNPALTGTDKPKSEEGLTGGVNPTPNPQEAEARKEEKKGSELRSGAGGAVGLPMDLPPDRPQSPRALVFGDGIPIIRGLTGQSEQQARQLLGRLLSSTSDDCRKVHAALCEAHDLKPAEPVAWLMRACGARRDGKVAKTAYLIEEFGGRQ